MSLAANGGAPSSSGLLTEAWPAQPGPERGDRGVANPNSEGSFLSQLRFRGFPDWGSF